MNRRWIIAALALPLALAGCAHRPPPPYYPPPPAYDAVAQQGFRDGFQAARSDISSGRPPGVEKHPRFRNPPVPPPAWEAYRRGFRDGYAQAMRPGGPPPPPPGME
jgi:hypothetical protein